MSQTIMRFQNPIILNSNGVSPIHAPLRLSSLIATTYIECSTSSIVNKQARKRPAYRRIWEREMKGGEASWERKALKVMIGPAR